MFFKSRFIYRAKNQKSGTRIIESGTKIKDQRQNKQ